MRAPRRRRFVGSIGFIVLVFNILLVFLPVAAFYFLDTYEKQLLRGLERAMSEQALMVAVALRGGEEGLAERAASFVAGLERGHEARIRVFSAEGSVLADSARAEPRTPAALPYSKSEEASIEEGEPGRGSLLYRFGSLPVRLFRRLLMRPSGSGEGGDLFDRDGAFARAPEIAAALAGRYGSMTRVLADEEGSTVRLYSSMPLLAGGKVGAVVLVSQSTIRIMSGLYAMRIDIFRIFLLSALVAVILSLVSDLLLARPLRDLAGRAAEIIDGRGRVRGGFPPLRAPGEIGLLSRALSDMGAKLERRTLFLESFSQDLAHEIRNPLASARASLELLEEGEEDEGRRGLLARAGSDIERIHNLVGDLREIASLDAEDARAAADPCHPAELARNLAEAFRARYPDIRLDLRLGPGAGPGDSPPVAAADPRRFLQALDDLLENAASFSPPSSVVDLELRLDGEGPGRSWVVSLRDRGPGFPPGDETRIFERFYSTRKEGGLHTGLGLAIVRSIAEGWGGSARAELAHPGARFILEMPCRPQRPDAPAAH